MAGDGEKYGNILADMIKELESMRDAVNHVSSENAKLIEKNENMNIEMSTLKRKIKAANYNVKDIKQSISKQQEIIIDTQTDRRGSIGSGYLSKNTIEIETGVHEDSFRRPKLKRRSSILDLFSSDGTNYIYNTKTIHMYAVTITCYTATKSLRYGKLKSCILAFVSLFVVFSQIFVVESLLYEASHPTCAAHTDCRSGEYCSYDKEYSESRQPRCSTCAEIFSEELKQKCASDSVVQSWQFSGFGKDVVWFNSDFATNIDITLLNLDSSVTKEDEDFYLLCVAFSHCTFSSHLAGIEHIPESMCPYLEVMMAQVSSNQIAVFAFVAILFGAALVEDMRESTIENALLDFSLKNISDNDAIPLSVFLIRISNLIRKYYLPSMTAGATVSIIISGALSAKNILLNLLTVLFVTEADNHLAAFFIPHSELALTDKIIEEANRAQLTFSGTESRVLGVILSVLIITVTVWLQSLIDLIAPKEGCSSVDDVLQGIFLFAFPLIIFAAKTFLACGGCFYSTKSKLSYLLKLSKMWTVFITSILFFELSLLSVSPDAWKVLPAVPLTFNLLASLCAYARIYQVMQSSEDFSALNYTLNVIFFLFWISIQIWGGTSIYATFQ